jgi:hypothetical protein
MHGSGLTPDLTRNACQPGPAWDQASRFSLVCSLDPTTESHCWHYLAAAGKGDRRQGPAKRSSKATALPRAIPTDPQVTPSTAPGFHSEHPGPQNCQGGEGSERIPEGGKGVTISLHIRVLPTCRPTQRCRFPMENRTVHSSLHDPCLPLLDLFFNIDEMVRPTMEQQHSCHQEHRAWLLWPSSDLQSSEACWLPRHR